MKAMAALSVAALLLAAAPANAGNGTARHISEALLQLDDMPDGYAAEEYDPDDGKASTTCGVEIAADATARADAMFSQGGMLGTMVLSSVVDLPRGEAKRIMTRLDAAVKKPCPVDISEASDGTVMKTTSSRLKMAKLCDQSVALRRVIDNDGVKVRADMVLFRCGDMMGALIGAGLMGAPAEFPKLAQRAAKRLHDF